jgi:hypothetical protein
MDMEPVGFLTVENGDDLIVSFAIHTEEFDGVKSLTLLRTPKYEFVFSGDERGVSVSHEDFPESGFKKLCRLSISADSALIETESQRFELDLSRVDASELEEAFKVLRLMNFDDSFVLQIA